MKISASKEFPGYDPLAASHAKVLLNGVEIIGVVYADEELGKVVQFQMDEKGQPVADHRTNRVKYVTRYGFVSLSLPDLQWYELQMRANQDHGS